METAGGNMKKLLWMFLLLTLFSTQILMSAPKRGRVKKTESQKMKEEIDRIEKRVNKINKNIEDYKANEVKLDMLEEKYDETIKDLRLD
jgi:gas vesicle protein